MKQYEIHHEKANKLKVVIKQTRQVFETYRV